MYKSPIFFDIHGTLCDPLHPLLKPAHDRLPYALREILYEKLPEDMNFLTHAGGTDYMFLKSLVKRLKSEVYLLQHPTILVDLMRSMESFYIRESDKDLSPSLYSGTVETLHALKKAGYPIGLVTGAAGQLPDSKNIGGVALHTLKQLGLDSFFDPSLIFTGEQPVDRDGLLFQAETKNLERFHAVENKAPGYDRLVYVADAQGDWINILRVCQKLKSYAQEWIPVRLILRFGPAMKGGEWLNSKLTAGTSTRGKEIFLAEQPQLIREGVCRLFPSTIPSYDEKTLSMSVEQLTVDAVYSLSHEFIDREWIKVEDLS